MICWSGEVDFELIQLGDIGKVMYGLCASVSPLCKMEMIIIVPTPICGRGDGTR